MGKISRPRRTPDNGWARLFDPLCLRKSASVESASLRNDASGAALSVSLSPTGRVLMPSIPLPNQPYPEPTPANPNPAPARPPEPRETPLPQPIGVPPGVPENVPPPTEPIGVPPTSPPEIPVTPTMPQPQA